MSSFWGSVDQGFKQRLDAMQPCTTMHGWFPLLPEQREWLTHLSQIPDRTTEWEVPEVLPPTLHLFTDGGARYPSEPRIRLAAWSFTVGDVEEDRFCPVSRGLVPGILQTVLRAEIHGAISALSFLEATQREGILWVDNLQVYRKIELFLRGEGPASVLETNHDLWDKLREITRRVNKLLLKVVKLPSHEDHSQFSEAVETWVLRGNDRADQEVHRAFDDMPQDFRACWERRISAHQTQACDQKLLHDHFLNVGRTAVAKGSTCSSAVIEVASPQHLSPQQVETEEEAIPILFHDVPRWDDGNGCDRLGPCGPAFHDWFTKLQTQHDSCPEWVTAYQLVVSFQLTTHCMGPMQHNKKWVRSEDVWTNGVGYSFLDQSRSFTNFMKYYGRCFGKNILSHFRRPSCTEKIGVWARCYRLNVSRSMLSEVDKVLDRHQSKPFMKMRRDFIDFPDASGH